MSHEDSERLKKATLSLAAITHRLNELDRSTEDSKADREAIRAEIGILRQQITWIQGQIKSLTDTHQDHGKKLDSILTAIKGDKDMSVIGIADQLRELKEGDKRANATAGGATGGIVAAIIAGVIEIIRHSAK